jgi:nucleoside-diphosphate-sugar epimerase
MKKTILIIGANSALAKDAVPILRRNNTIITAGRKDCDVYCDLGGPITIPAGVDTIINFAASFGGTADDEIEGAVHTNVLGVLRLCEAAHTAGVKQIVHISSIFALVDETSPSYSIYAITKRHGDELAQYYCQLNNILLTILRPSRIYGDSNAFARHQPFLYHIADKAQAGEDIAIYGTNDAARNYIHSVDLAEVMTRVIARRVAGVYACTYPTNATYSQIAHAAQRVFGQEGQVSFAKDKPDIPSDTFSLDQSVYEKIDYQPRISIETGMERIKHYREEVTV